MSEYEALGQTLSDLLDRYRDPVGNVNYMALLGDNTIVKHAESLANFNLDSLKTREERLAFWINSYNALSIYGVIKKIKSDPGFIKKGIGNWFGRVRFFALRKFNVGGKSYTLRTIENMIRREFKEPRIHFALNCSTLGCPVLKDGLYSAENLENELEEAARLYIRSNRGSRLDRDMRILHLSLIFKWYRNDFKATGKSLVQYVAGYLQEEDAEYLLNNEKVIKTRFIEYDWSLNNSNG
ncbi:MAG: DUF547 domain-containing protein [Candidatus Thorarchaeota archaeon]